MIIEKGRGFKGFYNPYFPRELAFQTLENQNLKLDVYFPKDTLKKHPTLIYFHGGSWVSGKKCKVLERYRNFTVKTLLDNNIEIISVDYRLIGLNNHLEDCISDCQKAVDFCIKNAEYLKIDTSKLALWGSSAGAHLALMTYILEPENQKFKFIIDDFAPTNISVMWSKAPDFFRKEISTYFYSLKEKDLEKFDSLSKFFSPVNYTEKLKKIPVLISHGNTDKIVNISQSEVLMDSLKTNAEFFVYENLGHGFKGMDSVRIKKYAERTLNFCKRNF
ncbi:MAG: alpha/beta hydrolase [Bacteroidales bacterium]|nr:alpha/beta hydrolase [Bacteroidales bacterium]